MTRDAAANRDKMKAFLYMWDEWLFALWQLFTARRELLAKWIVKEDATFYVLKKIIIQRRTAFNLDELHQNGRSKCLQLYMLNIELYPNFYINIMSVYSDWRIHKLPSSVIQNFLVKSILLVYNCFKAIFLSCTRMMHWCNSLLVFASGWLVYFGAIVLMPSS